MLLPTLECYQLGDDLSVVFFRDLPHTMTEPWLADGLAATRLSQRESLCLGLGVLPSDLVAARGNLRLNRRA